MKKLPIILELPEKLKKGDIFLCQSNMTGRYEIHTFHSDAGYGAKTYTDYNDETGSSIIVNYSGVRGVLKTKK